MATLLRVLGVRVIGRVLRRHPLVRRALFVGTVLRWFGRRYANKSQRVTLRRGETLRVEVVSRGQGRA